LSMRELIWCSTRRQKIPVCVEIDWCEVHCVHWNNVLCYGMLVEKRVIILRRLLPKVGMIIGRELLKRLYR
jgi:hypothetical protein